MKSLSERLLFISSAPDHFGSVRLRCKWPAEILNTNYVHVSKLTNEALEGRDIFVLMKTHPSWISKLQKRGTVIWDVLDEIPPQTPDLYFTSTKMAGEKLNLKKFHVINHPYVPIASIVDNSDKRVPYWIGSKHWKPDLDFFHITVATNNITVEALDQKYRQAGILLNLRIINREALFHAAINPGIKLINSIGYGIPSITSSIEAWIDELGPKATIRSTPENYNKNVNELLNNNDLYNELRNECLKIRHLYSPENISKRYIEIFNSII